MTPVKIECVDSDYTWYVSRAFVGRPLTSGESVVIYHHCDEPMGAPMTVGTPGDSNVSNNFANFHS